MLRKSLFFASFFFLLNCTQQEKYDGWLELSLIDAEKKGTPLSCRKVSIGIRSLKYQLFEHHLEVFQGLTDKNGRVRFRPLEGKEYWITVYEVDDKIYSMSLIERDKSKNKVVLPIEKWKLPNNSNGIPDINIQ